MNQFSILSAYALNSGATDATTVYMGSQAYRDRTDFKGATGLKDMLNIQLYLLSRVALDSRSAVANRNLLSRGVVKLNFFGISNPTPCFELAVGSLELQRLQDCFEANLAGPLVAASARVLKWRSSRTLHAKQARRIDKLIGALRDSLTWPDAATRYAEPARADAVSKANYDALSSKSAQLWAQRQTRLAKLSHATAIGVTGWTELLADVSANVLQPET